MAVLSTMVANATHIVGGDMYYEYLGNNSYRITLTVYRDCGPGNVNGTGFDDFATIGVYETATDDYYTEFSMDLSSAEVDWVPVELENPCFILPPDVCVERAQYEEVVNLPFNTGGYTLVYSRCCRNSTIINLDFPQTQGTSIVTFVPGSGLVSNPNTSAQFINFPPVALCANAEFFFDASATDEDGDQLVYSFCDPYLGGTTNDPAPAPPMNLNLNTVDWAAGFSATSPVTSNPPLTIDPNTGLVTGTATEIGRYAIAICCSEYRDGQLINTIIRDFQFNVTLCDPNIIASVPEQGVFCNGASVTFENTSINASFFHWDFGVEGIDSDTSNVESPTYTYPVGGEFTVTLIANPGWPCADTTYSSFQSYPPILPEITYGNYLCENDLDYYNMQVNGDFGPNATFEWSLSPGTVPSIANTQVLEGVQMNPELLITTATVTVSDNGCQETTSVEIETPADPIAIINPQEAFCNGLEYTFTQSSENEVTWLWDFGAPGSADASTLETPTYTYWDTGHYEIRLIVTAPFTCPDTAYSELNIYGLLAPTFADQESQCLEGNSFDFVADGASTTSASYQWTFESGATPSASSSPSPQNISFDEPGWYNVTLTISENGCTESYTDSVWVVSNFENNFSVSSTPGCPPVSAGFYANSVAEVPVYYQWSFGDGETSTTQNPTHFYEEPGTYNVTVTAYTLWGCVESESASFPNAVSVLYPPVPGFTITPQILDILDPTVTIMNTSQGAEQCYYVMSDGGTSDDCNFNYSFSEAGIQTVTQVVVNEYGCAASTSGQVIINGFLFFAPNAFSPNNDGLNEFWIPESTGISEYQLRIFDRWGEIVFESTNPEEPWTGNVKGGSHFAADGVYAYLIKANDLLGLPHEFKGHIVLTR